ncbi:flagellin [Psychrobacillus sp. L3]|uniref:flagellin N-terminal helical domain-containing protein n=1 Tax=Psychrobacillus sp. L3 TaxID=3236891 RepID=UPI0036F2D4B1
MIIKHNISSLNTNNKLKINREKTAKSLEKLSSGFRINRAGDDAAGLAISEKMRGQIRGLNMAGKNIQDGISLIQTAEGGLGNIQNPNLIRLRELAIQSANDTLTDEDRKLIQKEVEQIKQGINEIANNTEFNGINLLNIPESTTVTTSLEVTDYEADLSVVDITKAKSITIYEITDGVTHTIEIPVSSFNDGITWSPPNNSLFEEYIFKSLDVNPTQLFQSIAKHLGQLEPRNNITGVKLNGIEGYDQLEIFGKLHSASYIDDFGKVDPDHSVKNANSEDLTDYPEFLPTLNEDTELLWVFYARKQITNTNAESNNILSPLLSFQTGANSRDSVSIELSDVRTTALGIDNIDLSTRQGAESAISKIDEAIAKVSSERGKFGAYQNRLEHAYNSVMNTSENLQSAESRIRDTDMAKEMMEFTKNNILTQAAQSMLAQSNQQSESVLQLLK